MRSIVYLFLIFCLGLTIIPAYSQISWINPQPQGNPIKAVCFTENQTGFLTGDAGALLRTDDNGLSWTSIDSITINNIYAVDFFDSQNGLLAGDSGIIMRSTDGGLSWALQNSVTSKPLNGIKYLDSLTAIAVGNQGTILKSTDGGQNWYEVNSTIFLHLSAISFPEDSVGYVVGGDHGLKGIIMKTSDYGESWDTLSNLFDGHLYAIWFSDSLKGYTSGYNNRVYKTTSGGEVWAILDTPNWGSNHHIRDMEFTDFNTGYTVDIHGIILRTFNAGATWDSLNSQTTTPFYAIGSNSEGNLYAGGLGGKIIRTNDQGLNWQEVSNGAYINLISIDFPTSEKGFITGTGGLFKTMNSGQQWDYIEAEELDYIVDAHFIGPETGFAMDSEGTIYRTSDAGESWTLQHQDDKAQSYNAIYMASPMLGFAVGGGYSSNNTWSMALRTTDGENWTNLPISHVKPLQDVYFINTSEGFICGDEGTLLYTSNSGNNWSLKIMDTTYKLIDINFLNQNIGFMVGIKAGSSIVYRTTDGGNSWHEFFQPLDLKSNEKINAVRFADTVNGFVVGSNGLIYKTIDGGESWFRARKITNNFLNDVYPRGGFDGFITGTGGTILRMDPVVGIDPLASEESHSFSIYPNPASGTTTLHFTLHASLFTVIDIYGIDGKKIYEIDRGLKDRGNHEIQIDLQHLPEGVYLISIMSGQSRMTEKLIIQQ